MIITAKTLSGEYITLDISNSNEYDKDFENVFKEKYIKKKFKPYISIHLLDYENCDEKNEKIILVNTHKIIPLMDMSKIVWFYLFQNDNPEATKMCIEFLKSNNFDNFDNEIDNEIDEFDLLSLTNNIAVDYICNLLEDKKRKKQEIDIYIISKLATNTNTRVLELLFEFEEQFKYEQEIWYELATNSNPYVFQKFLEKMDEHEHFRKNFSFSELCLSFNKQTVDWVLKNPQYINYNLLSRNPYAIDHLLENKKNIDWKNLSLNPHSKAVQLLKKNKTKINLENLALNKSEEAIDLLKEIMTCEAKFSRFSKKQKEMIYKNLHVNPYAIDIILDFYKDKDIKDKDIKDKLWINPSIFYPYIDNDEDIYI
jgi:hypothetical protein